MTKVRSLRLRWWISRDEDSSAGLRICNFSRLGRWAFAACVPVFVVAALPESGWRLVELVAYSLLVGAFLYRFAWAHVEVTSQGVTYRGILRTRHWPWSEIDGFLSSTNGVELVADDGGQVVSLMPTKRTSWSSERTMRNADALCSRMTSYAPDPDKYAMQASEPPSNVRRID